MPAFPDKKLLIATHNQGKWREINALLYEVSITGLKPEDYNLEAPEENGRTFKDNAVIKARHAANSSGCVSLADDSGLCVCALGDAPGVYSARYAGKEGDFTMAMEKIEAALQRGRHTNREAYFVCALALAWPEGTTRTFEGRVDGVVTWPARGKLGFGYDPIFIPHGHSKTFGEMPPDKKHAISHRAKAFEKLQNYLL